jgi:hypothetical protein
VDARTTSAENVERVTWPLVGSLILTGIVVAIVCVPPFHGLKTWGQVLWLACVYLLIAAVVHALAVWSIFRIQSEGVREWTRVWPVVWGAWIAVVWLPLVALLTYERSDWVAVIVPLAAVFLTLFVVSRRHDEEDEVKHAGVLPVRPELFALDESPRLWRVLLPSLLIVVVLDGGMAMYAANHAWMAGILFAGAATYFCERLLNRTAEQQKVREVSVQRGAAGNSVAVWMMTVVALLPFLAGVGAVMRGWVGMSPVQAADHFANAARRAMRGYEGIILTRPKMRQEIVTPVLAVNTEGLKKNHDIPFDGQYWYFQWPDSRPGPDAHIVPGDPTKSQIKSTDHYPIVMEAHQRLAKPMETGCCRTLQVNVVNADAVPGTITLDVVLKDASGKPGSTVRLGTQIVVSSTVSPMPLHRGPVQETLVFQFPRGAKNKRFDEIAVRVRPESSRSLTAPSIAIESFAFQR